MTPPKEFAGAYLIPCGLDKRPLVKHGWHEASADPLQIAAWERQFPGCNWAVATGLSGLFVIDVDPAGLKHWRALVEGNSAVRDAVERAYKVQTPRGGFHYYWRGEGPSTASRIAEGIDTRGGIKGPTGEVKSGGYVLLPGSKTAHGPYVALGGMIEDMPDCIRALVPERKSAATKGLEVNPDLDLPRNVQWAETLLKDYVRDGRVSIEGQGGNDTAFRVAASVLDKGISPAKAFDLLWERWNPHCKPPWDDWELERIVQNAATYGEETRQGSKAIIPNQVLFQSWEGKQIEKPAALKRRNGISWIHDYADNVDDPSWLIPSILPSQGIGIIYGASGSYKSFLVLDMALCLAYGHPGQWDGPPTKNDVLFLAGEGPVSTAKKRWPAWLEWQGLQDKAQEHRFLIHDRVPFYHDTESWEAIRYDLDKLKARPSLIVIDTLSRLMTGMDENSAKDATMITSFMEQLAQTYECFVLAVHHEGKDAKRGARGSYALVGNVDTMLSVKKREGGMALRVIKQKDADVSSEPILFEVQEYARSIVLAKTDSLPEAPKAGKSRIDWMNEKEIIAILNRHGGTLSTQLLAAEIAQATNLDIGKIRRRIMASDNLKWLRDGDQWRLPKEFDL